MVRTAESLRKVLGPEPAAKGHPLANRAQDVRQYLKQLRDAVDVAERSARTTSCFAVPIAGQRRYLSDSLARVHLSMLELAEKIDAWEGACAELDGVNGDPAA